MCMMWCRVYHGCISVVNCNSGTVAEDLRRLSSKKLVVREAETKAKEGRRVRSEESSMLRVYWMTNKTERKGSDIAASSQTRARRNSDSKTKMH